MLDNVFHVIAQVFFGFWLVEEVRQQADAVDANLFGMFAQVVHITNITAANAQHAVQSVFTAAFHPFFGQSLAFVGAQACQFTNFAVDQNTANAFRFQEVTVLVDNIVFNGFSRAGIRNQCGGNFIWEIFS